MRDGYTDHWEGVYATSYREPEAPQHKLTASVGIRCVADFE